MYNDCNDRLRNLLRGCGGVVEGESGAEDVKDCRGSASGVTCLDPVLINGSYRVAIGSYCGNRHRPGLKLGNP